MLLAESARRNATRNAIAALIEAGQALGKSANSFISHHIYMNWLHSLTCTSHITQTRIHVKAMAYGKISAQGNHDNFLQNLSYIYYVHNLHDKCEPARYVIS